MDRDERSHDPKVPHNMFAIRSSRQQVRSASRALALGLRNESSASSSAITKSGDAHNGPGGSLTTAQPKEEIIAADVLSDAPRECGLLTSSE